ncbi:MAG: GNAT family N-acetyltransferase [Gammaproteobacteria bacterium]|nr:GNAT family N-acetyltransferase [Gammaproteobacteria bacterium]
MSRALRRASPSDLDALVALERACFGARDGAFNRRQLRALLGNPNAHWLLAADGRAMACWLRCANGRARWARLYSLAVHPGARGQGRGGALLAAGRRWMRGQRLAVCYAEVKAANRAARGLYARHGFHVWRALPDYYGRGRNGVRLKLRLPAVRPVRGRARG